MMTKIQVSIAVALTITMHGQTFAQTRVQCHIDDSGRVSAALIWQNTLGAERANGICRASFAEVNRAQETRSDPSPPAAPVSANQQQFHPHSQPKPVSHPAVQRQASGANSAPASAHTNAGQRADLAADAPIARIEHGDLNRGRFEPGVYERAGVVRPTAHTGRANHPVGSQHSPAGNDYVPLHQEGSNSGDEGYIAIW